MKICFVINSLDNGGAERVMSTLANYFSKEHNISIIMFSSNKPFYFLEKSINIYTINANNKSLNIFNAIKNNLNNIKKLKKKIEEINPDIVISFMTTANILSIIACKIIKKPIIISERTNYDFLSNKFWKVLRRLIYPLSDMLVVQSDYDATKYYYVSNVKKIANPLYFISKEYKVSKRGKIILAVGRLDKVKGFDMLIEAYKKLKTDYILMIVGEGNERENLEKLIKDYNLVNKVFLVGQKSNIQDYYLKASIFVLSSRMEGFPNVLVEAMAFGCPVVAFNCKTGPSEIIKNGENGILVEAENINELAKAIQKLLDSNNLRYKLGKNAMKINELLNIKTIANEWIELIYSITRKT